MSSYFVARERELETLCDPRVRNALDDLGIVLVSFADVGAIAGGPQAG